MADEEQRLINLEIKLTYMERTVETLNDVVVELRGELSEMRKNQLRLEQVVVAGDEPAD